MSENPPEKPEAGRANNWHSLSIPKGAPITGDLWRFLRNHIPEIYHDKIPLIRRDLEGYANASINADTELLLLMEIANQVRHNRILRLLRDLKESQVTQASVPEPKEGAEHERLNEILAQIQHKLDAILKSLDASGIKEQTKLAIAEYRKSADLPEQEEETQWWWNHYLTLPLIYWLLGGLLVLGIIF